MRAGSEPPDWQVRRDEAATDVREEPRFLRGDGSGTGYELYRHPELSDRPSLPKWIVRLDAPTKCEVREAPRVQRLRGPGHGGERVLR